MTLTRLFFWTLSSLIPCTCIFSQAPNLEFTLRYNPAQNRYEVYARPSATQAAFNWGPSQISVVAPASLDNAAFTITSVAGGAWIDNSQVYGPAADPAHDFHGVGSLGAPTGFTANVEKLIFHFALPGGGCTAGLRLYINGTDPNSAAPGMAGGDFSNTVFAIVPGVPEGYESYIGNYNNAGTNCPPVANNDLVSTNEDVPLTFNPLANDTDPNNNINPASVVVITGPANGTTSVNPVTGEITYTPNANFNGTNTLIYAVCDSGTPVFCDTAVITITVNPVDDNPIANDDTFTLNEDAGATNIPVLTNDNFGGDGPSVTAITITTPPTHGTATVNNNGTPTNPTDDFLVYTPAANYNGTDQITYQICDSDGDCDPGTVVITVSPVDDNPIANDDTFTLNEDAGATPILVVTNDDFGGDGPSITSITITGTPTHGTATVNNNGTPTNPTDDYIVYTPDANYNGPDQVTYQICDADGDCDGGTVVITVSPVDDLPIANDDTFTLNEDAGATSIPVVTNDNFGGDGPSITSITITTPPTHGTATVNNNGTPTNPTDDYIVYTPDANYNGPDQVTYQICDADGDCDGGTVVITVSPVDDLPIANDDTFTLNEDAGATPIAVVPNDNFGGDGPSITAITITTPPTHGTATVNNNGTPTNPTDDFLVYTPAANYNGTDQITYQICDADGDCDPGTVVITVSPVDDNPIANDDTFTLNEDAGATSIPVVTNDNFGGDGPSITSITITTPPTHGTATVNNNGTPTDPTDDYIVYTPDANYNGPDQVTYQICDADGDCDGGTVVITVSPVDDLPIANDDTFTLNEDAGATPIAVVPNDNFGGDGPSITAITIITPPTHGTATVNNNGTPANPTDDFLVYTPAANYNGTDQITYQICDADGDCDPATVNITVSPVDDLPIANDDTFTLNEDAGATSIPVVTNDNFGGDGPSITSITITTPPTHGTATVNNNGTPTNPTDDYIVYTPDANYNGPDQVTYQICDADGDCDGGTVVITVSPVDDLPIANDDTFTLNEDAGATPIAVVSNDNFGGDGPSITAITITTPPTHGTATVNNNGTPTNPTDDFLVYTPAANYNGTDQITYQICDADGDCDPATVNITVSPVDDLPIANDDTFTLNEDAGATSIPVVTNDNFGGDGPSITSITITTPPTHGTATVNNNGTPTNPTDDYIVYTPDANYNGPDQVTYQICDADGDCDGGTVVITVSPVDDLPIANDDTFTLNEDAGATNIPVVPNDNFGGDGPSITAITITTPPTHGTATVNNNGTPTNPTDDFLVYTPAANYNGTDQITYQICDADGDCDPGTVVITISPVDDLPIANDDTFTLNEDAGATSIPVVTNDNFGGDGPSITSITITTPPTHGTAVVNNNGTPTNPTDDYIVYTPDANYNGPDQVTYQICDADGDCDGGTVVITVSPVDDLPIANDDTFTLNEDAGATPIAVVPNDNFGGDGPSITAITITTPPTHGTATVNNNGTPTNPTDDFLVYTPAANYNGTDQITYQICDADGDCDPGTVVIAVTPVDDLPVANDDVVTMNEDAGATNVPVLVNDNFGGDGSSVTAITITTPPTHGMAVVNNNGTPANPTDDYLVYTPAANYNGTDQITYQICDFDGDCDPATVSVTINPVNDGPVANNDTQSTNEDTPTTFNPLVNDTDPENNINPTSVTVLTGPDHGTTSVNPVTGEITYTPDANYSGPDALTYQVCDTGSPVLCSTATVTIDVIFDPIAKLQVKVMLQGAMIGVSDGLMRDDLRAGGYLPLTEPYTAMANTRFTHVGGGGETTTAGVLAANAGTANAIVDWVFVELRSGTDSSVVLQTRSALVQRDGDVVSATDGTSMLTFNGLVGQQYFIAVKHRNHLGAMTATKIGMTNDGTIVNFINATDAQVYDRPGSLNYNGVEMVTVQTKRALWAGNTNANNKVKYQGTLSDNIPVLTPVLNYPGNTAGTYNYNLAFGYFLGDVNMDGKVKYQGTANDVSFIFVNIVGLYTALNTAGLYNYDLFLEQLPN